MVHKSPLSTCGEEAAEERSQCGIAGAVRAVLTGISPLGEPLVDFYGNSAGVPLAAPSLVAIGAADVGREAVVLFEDGDPGHPIIIGLIRPPALQEAKAKSKIEVALDGRRLTLSAEQEIVLSCGEAKIVLTRAGKVLINGSYVLTHSRGVNRIRGGSVQIN